MSVFNGQVEKQKHADESVAAGREFIEAYVTFHSLCRRPARPD